MHKLSIFIVLLCAGSAFSQSYIADMARESARSDKLTEGRIQKAPLIPGDPDIRITINVPAFKMTLWQSGKEIKTYPIGVGLLEYPIMIGRLQASSVEWNPVWLPPSSDWIEKSSTVKPGEIVLPTDPRNPLGKVKIPLGYGYLIHQAKAPTDLGSLVSHGCVRVMQADLYDLAEKIVAARSLPVSAAQIARAKRNKKTLLYKFGAERGGRGHLRHDRGRKRPPQYLSGRLQAQTQHGRKCPPRTANERRRRFETHRFGDKKNDRLGSRKAEVCCGDRGDRKRNERCRGTCCRRSKSATGGMNRNLFAVHY